MNNYPTKVIIQVPVMKKLLSVAILIICTFSQLSAQEADSANTAEKVLKVGYVGSAPFVIQPNENEDPEGIVFDIWERIAYNTHSHYELIPFSSVEEGLQQVGREDIDILIGPITITSDRAERVNFSQPYYDTQLAILAPVLKTGFWDHIVPFFSGTFLLAILGLLIILSVVGFLFWLVEARHDPENYDTRPVRGIGTGVWLAVVTMTTVGYGDFAPKTTAGRIVMGSWMVISLILATTFVAGIATTFSMLNSDSNTITTIAQMSGKTVAVPASHKAEDLIRNAGGKTVAVQNVAEAYDMLLNEKVDAIVYDQVPLEYVLENSKRDEYVLTKNNIQPQYYGFAYSIGNPLKRQVDLEIIRMQENHEILSIVDDWLNRR